MGSRPTQKELNKEMDEMLKFQEEYILLNPPKESKDPFKTKRYMNGGMVMPGRGVRDTKMG
mgnify:FL=1